VLALLPTLLLMINHLAWAETPPLGLPACPIPAGNPITEEKVTLGRKLFFDRRLSFNGTLSCGMCHIPEQGFTQTELKTPVGVEGRIVKRNAPSLYNVAYRITLFHDGREDSLENQVWQPLLRRNEMANPSIGFVLSTIRGAADYDGLFETAFNQEVAMESVGKALASYQRSLVSGNSRFDRWYYGGDQRAMSESEVRGFTLFQAKSCVSCHTIGPNFALFSDGLFHDTGVGFYQTMNGPDTAVAKVRLAPGVEVVPKIQFQRPVVSDLGRYEATGQASDRWLYRTPSLRNVAITAPYMHNGSLPDLHSVVEFYNRGTIPHTGLDSRLKPLGLSGEQVQDLVDFLHAITGSNIDQLRDDARSAAIGNPQAE
jgi:cytochrome c peroxidase